MNSVLPEQMDLFTSKNLSKNNILKKLPNKGDTVVQKEHIIAMAIVKGVITRKQL